MTGFGPAGAHLDTRPESAGVLARFFPPCAQAAEDGRDGFGLSPADGSSIDLVHGFDSSADWSAARFQL